MGDTTATTASQGLDGLGTPDVRGCVLRMPRYPDCASDLDRPQRAIATADRAITVDEGLRRLRDVDANRAAMTCAREHSRTRACRLTAELSGAHADS
jgi:hypothetical protein